MALQTLLDGLGGRGAIFDDTPFASSPPRAGYSPDLLYSDLAAQGATSLFVSCPALRSSLPSNARFATEADRETLKFSSKAPSATLHQISAPVIDVAGRHALVEVRFTCRGLCGLGTLQPLEKRKGHWAPRKSILLWMS